jgi:hypothetical protein
LIGVQQTLIANPLKNIVSFNPGKPIKSDISQLLCFEFNAFENINPMKTKPFKRL